MSEDYVDQVKNSQSNTDHSYESIYAKGVFYEAHGNYIAAVVEYEKATRLFPDHLDAHRGLVRLCGVLGREDQAIAKFFVFHRLCRIKPVYKLERHWGVFDDYRFEELGFEYDDPWELEEDLEVDREDALYSEDCELGYDYLVRRECHANIIELMDEIDLHPDCAEAHYQLGDKYKTLSCSYGRNSKLGEYYLLAAIAEFEATLRICPDYYCAYNELEFLSAFLDENLMLTVDYSQVKALRPPFFVVWYNLGNYFFRIKKYQLAIEEYRSAAIMQDYVEAYYALGVALLRICEFQEAILTFKEAIQINSNHVEAHYYLGNSCFAIGNYYDAIASCKEAVRINPFFVDAYYGLGLAYEKLDQHQEATEEYGKVLNINPDYMEFEYNVGKTGFQRIKDQRAR